MAIEIYVSVYVYVD